MEREICVRATRDNALAQCSRLIVILIIVITTITITTITTTIIIMFINITTTIQLVYCFLLYSR